MSGILVRPTFTFVLFLAAVFALIKIPPLRCQEEKLTIAVIPFTAPGMSEMEKNALTTILRRELVSSRHLDVVERGQMDKLLAEQAIQATGCTTEECAVEIGKILNATHVVLGSISQLGRKWIVSLRLVDVELGRIDHEVLEERICELEDLSRVVREAAGKLLEKALGKEPEPERFGSIHVTSTPSGADVTVNGTPVGKTPLTLDALKPGPHQLSITAEGYKAWRRTVIIEAGEKREVFATLSAIPPSTGSIQVTSSPSGADVSVSGAPVGTTPVLVDDLKPGPYDIRVVAEGHLEWRRVVSVVPGKTTKIFATLEPIVMPPPPTEEPLWDLLRHLL